MKKILIVSMLLCTLIAKAQGPQQLVSVPYDYWAGANVPGWLYLPADYSNTTKRYPVVFFYHGLGEAGTNPYTLLNQGVPNLIANGMRPDNITNPVDGQQYSFIVLSVQHWSWSPNPNWLPYELAWLKANYRIDTNRVYVTGLSAGGQMSFSAATNATVSSLITAAVPMSPAQVWPYDPTPIGQNKIETWFFAGNVDGGYTNNATTYNSDCNTQYAGSSKLNIYPGGHCCWNTYYNTAWRDPGTNLSVWEWMLTNVKENTEPMPVKFINLDLQKVNNGVRITWKVESESLLNYEIEKSTDGRNFSKIGTVAATNQSEYSFTDFTQQTKCFYRIKSVDPDGTFKYSIVLSYNNVKATVVIKAFPMPAHSEITLQHPVVNSHSMIQLNAIDGRLIKMISPAMGTQQTSIDLSTVKPGAYFLKYDDGTGSPEILKITRQ